MPGEHSVSNVLAAVAVGLLFGIAPDAIRRAVAEFAGVEHRLEPVAELDGVRYVNDSQGTQPDAVIAALRSFEPPIVLIAGGREKGVAIDALARVVAQRAAAAVLIGETAPDFEAAFERAGAGSVEIATTSRPRSSAPTAWHAKPSTSGRCERRRREQRVTGDRAAQPGRRELRHVRRLRGARPRVQGRRARRCRTEGAADEEPAHRHPGATHPATGRGSAQASSRRPPRGTLAEADRDHERERHEPD